MSAHVKGVSETASQIEDINRMAASVNESLARNLAAVKDALEMAQEVSDQLGKAGDQLRGILAPASNREPQDSK